MNNINKNNEEIMTIKHLLVATNGVFVGDDSFLNNKITGANINSKEIKKNELFIPLKGSKFDGHDYIEDAIKNGALISLSEKKLENPTFPYIIVNDCRKAFLDIAAYYRKSLNIKIIAVTGSVGKTSTKEMIASVLSTQYKVLKTKGNLNNDLGLPMSILSIKPYHEVAVLEIGINHFGEMDVLGSVAKPDIAIITNIADCHLENLIDRAGVYKAKSELFNHLASNKSIIILNGDDGILGQIDKISNYKIMKFGLSNENDVYASNIKELGLKGIEGCLHIYKSQASFTLNKSGLHSIYNMLCASCVASILNISIDKIIKGANSNTPLPGHGLIINTPKFTILDESYNANPASMHACLNMLEKTQGRKIAILGDMGELGESEKDLHKQLGLFIATKNIDILICVGKLSKHIIYATNKAEEERKDDSHETTQKTKCFYFETKTELYKNIHSILLPGDNILVKSSHFMHFEEIVSYLSNY